MKFDVAFQTNFSTEESMKYLGQILLKLLCETKDAYSVSLFAFQSFSWLLVFTPE